MPGNHHGSDIQAKDKVSSGKFDLGEGIGRQRTDKYLPCRGADSHKRGIFIKDQERFLRPYLNIIAPVHRIGDPLDRYGEHLTVVL